MIQGNTNKYKPAGRYEINFDASKLSSGVYFYQFKAGDYINTKKCYFSNRKINNYL